jgi:hypothetical protein
MKENNTCDVCEKEFPKDNDGKHISGIFFSIVDLHGFKKDTEIKVCYVCWIRSLGVDVGPLLI